MRPWEGHDWESCFTSTVVRRKHVCDTPDVSPPEGSGDGLWEDHTWAERNRDSELSTELKFYCIRFHILFRDVALVQKREMAVLLIFNKPNWLFFNQRSLCYFPKNCYAIVIFPKQTFIVVSASNLIFLFCIFMWNCSIYVNINFVFQIMAIICVIYIYIWENLRWKVAVMTWKAANVTVS